jgi:CBS domain-containing protein
MKAVKDVMTTPVITVTPETSIKDLATLLTKNQISGAPVVDNAGILLGIVTETDLLFTEKPLNIPAFFIILDTLVYLENPFKLEKELKELTARTVADIYTHECLTANPDMPVGRIANLMVTEKKYLLPVIDQNEKVIGIISRTDMMSLIS